MNDKLNYNYINVEKTCNHLIDVIRFNSLNSKKQEEVLEYPFLQESSEYNSLSIMPSFLNNGIVFHSYLKIENNYYSILFVRYTDILCKVSFCIPNNYYEDSILNPDILIKSRIVFSFKCLVKALNEQGYLLITDLPDSYFNGK